MQNLNFVKVFVLCVTLSFLCSVASLANPAAVNCGNLNGVEFLTTDSYGGQAGYCRFGSSAIEDWTLFRKSVNPPPLAISSYLSITTPYDNPATACSTLQGNLLSLGTQPSATTTTVGIQVCQFSDGSSIGAATLAAGPQDPSNAVLTSILLSN